MVGRWNVDDAAIHNGAEEVRHRGDTLAARAFDDLAIGVGAVVDGVKDETQVTARCICTVEGLIGCGNGTKGKRAIDGFERADELATAKRGLMEALTGSEAAVELIEMLGGGLIG